MSLVSSSLPNLVNGVSQQPYVQRLISQGELQINGYSSLVEGLRKRPPAEHLAKLRSTPLTNAYVHTINRSPDEQYEVIFDGAQVQVFDMAGNPRTVNAPNGWGYATSTDPQHLLSATTVADYTFITNRAVGIGLTGLTSPTRPFEAIIWVRAGNYSTPFNLTVNGRSVNWTTTDTSNPIDGAGITTEYICQRLTQGLTGAPTGIGLPGESGSASGPVLTGFTSISNFGSVIYLASNTDFTVTSSDGQGDTAIVVSKGTVQSFSNLPQKCVNGVVFAVTGTGGDGTSPNYYVRYDADAGNPQGGVWVECPKPGEQIQFDPATMPHQLVRNADGSFTFQQAAWANRTTGDIATLPFPSFVGKGVFDVFFYQDRLGFLAGENVVMSRTGNAFDFTRASALQLLDTDPIDLGSTSNQVSTLVAAVPFQNTLLLFSGLVQFQLTYESFLSPKTASITPATNFTMWEWTKPSAAGPNVFFAFQRGAWTGIREYYLEGAGRINDANEVTSHVPKYLPGAPVSMSTATNEDVLAVITDGDRTSLWVYRYFWQGDQKLQSSWSQWQFQPTDYLLSAQFIQNNLYVVISRADGVFLERINVQANLTETGQNFLAHLDRKVYNPSSTYDPVLQKTTITLPYIPADWSKVACVTWGGGVWDVGVVLPVTPISANSFTVPGNTGGQTICGINYTFRYRFSTFAVREPVSMTYSMQVVTEGRLQVRNVLVNYATTGYFRAEVTPLGRQMGTYVYTAGMLGQVNSAAGRVWTNTGTFKFPVQCQNINVTVDLVNDSFLPCYFESAGWEGFYVLRSRRM
jgi:hypothetical protein